MYIKKYFNLRRNPFKNTTDPDFYYLTESARKAYRCITDAIYQKIPYVVLSGDPGTGKTTLLKCLMTDDTLPVHWIFFNHASLEWEEILLAMGRALKISDTQSDAGNVAQKIVVRLKQIMDQAASPVLIIDEAQRLTRTTLLSLFEWHTDLKTQGVDVTVILSGQAHFTRALTDSNLSRFTADATVHCRLEKLTPSECREMIAYRLKTAGYSGPPLFSKKTLKIIFQLSGGNPRMLNSICDFGLFKAATHARRKVSCEDIRHMPQHLHQKGEAPHKAKASFKVAGPLSGIVSILPMIWRIWRKLSVFSQGISGDLWENMTEWRSFFSPWKCGIAGLFILLVGGSFWFRVPAAITPIQTLVADSQVANSQAGDLSSGGQMSIQRFKIDTVKTNSDVMPAQTDTLLVHGTTDIEKIKLDVIEQSMETTDSLDLSGSLARVDTAIPAIGREIAKAMETALRQQPVIYAKYHPATKPKPVIKNRLAIAKISPVSQILSPPAKSSPLVSVSPSPPEQPQVAVKNLQQDRSPVLPQPALSQPVASSPEKPGPDPNFLLTAIQRGDVDTVRESLSKGVNPNIIFSETSTALTMAVDRGQIAMVNVLLDKGAAINQPTPSGETALMKSVWAGHEVITDLLLRHGAEVNAQNREGWTPLFYGSVMGRRRIVKRLLECGARLDLVDRDGRAPLMAAAWNGHVEVVRYLLAHGAPPNIQDRDGWTPLMFAAFEGHTDVVQTLISQGANLRQKNNRGQSSAALATNRGHAELYAMISTLAKH